MQQRRQTNFAIQPDPPVVANELPVTIIPAPARRRNLSATLQELEAADRGERSQPESRAGSIQQNDGPSVPRDQDSIDPHRRAATSDPYTPSDLNRQLVTQRGAISFVTALQQDVAIRRVTRPRST